jgi:hypothetical protein
MQRFAARLQGGMRELIANAVVADSENVASLGWKQQRVGRKA